MQALGALSMVCVEWKGMGSVGWPDLMGTTSFLPENQWYDSLQYGEGQEEVHVCLVS